MTDVQTILLNLGWFFECWRGPLLLWSFMFFIHDQPHDVVFLQEQLYRHAHALRYDT